MSALVAAVGLQRQQLVQASSSRSVALTATIQLLFRRPPKDKLQQSKKQSSSRLRSGVCGVEPGEPERGAPSGWASAVADASRASAREPNHRTAPRLGLQRLRVDAQSRFELVRWLCGSGKAIE